MGRVVVVGGGFAGVTVAAGVARSGHDTTLVNAGDHLVHRPRLVRLPAEQVPVRLRLRELAARQGWRLATDTVTGIDASTGMVQLGSGGTLPFAVVVVACGAVADRSAVPGAATHALFPCDLDDALRLRDRLARDAGTVTVVVGGQRPGPGLEFAGWLSERVRQRPSDVVIRVVDPQPTLAAHLGERASAAITDRLAERGVEVVTGTAVREVAADAVVLDDGRRLASDVTAVVGHLRGADVGLGPPFVDALGFVRVDDNFRSVVNDRLFAVGDAAAPPVPLPKAMVLATAVAPLVARNTAAVIDGTPRSPFPFPRVDRFAIATPDLGGWGVAVHVPSGRVLATGRAALVLRAAVERRVLHRVVHG